MATLPQRDPGSAVPSTPQVPGLLRLGLHVLVGALLLLSAWRAVAGDEVDAAWTVAATLAVGAVYAVGQLAPRVSRSRAAAGAWLALLLAAWLVLLLLTPDAIYLAFAWFFLILRLLPRGLALAAVGATTAVAIGGFVWHAGTFTAAMVIGPVIGAAVAIATVLGYQALQSESEQRRRLIVELERTRSELASAERRAGVLDERERLAREIHDTLAQGLTSIQLLLRAAGRNLDPGPSPEAAATGPSDRGNGGGTERGIDRGIDPARAAALVEQARQAAADNLAEARRLVRALAPGELEGTSLSPALRRLCAATTERSGIRVSFHHDGPEVALPAHVEAALLRIAQTALGNTTQHSGATRADVSLTVMDDAVTLDVVDDGTGFDLDALSGPGTRQGEDGGFGLRSMRSRAQEIGGRLVVESEPGQGTAVSVQVDLSDEPPLADGGADVTPVRDAR